MWLAGFIAGLLGPDESAEVTMRVVDAVGPEPDIEYAGREDLAERVFDALGDLEEAILRREDRAGAA